MAGDIDQHVDTVIADVLRQGSVGQRVGHRPMLEQGAVMCCQRVRRLQNLCVGKQLETLVIVVLQQRQQEVTGRVFAKTRAHISHAQAAPGVAVVAMGTPGRVLRLTQTTVELLVGGKDLFSALVGMVIEDKQPVAVGRAVVGFEP